MNYIVEQTEAFAKWHSGLRDLRAKTAISRRIATALSTPIWATLSQ